MSRTRPYLARRVSAPGQSVRTHEHAPQQAHSAVQRVFQAQAQARARHDLVRPHHGDLPGRRLVLPGARERLERGAVAFRRLDDGHDKLARAWRRAATALRAAGQRGGASGAPARARERVRGLACSSVGPSPRVGSGSLCLARPRTACSSSSSDSASAPQSHASARRRRTHGSTATFTADGRRAPWKLRRGSRWLRSGAASAPGTTTVSSGLRRCCWLIELDAPLSAARRCRLANADAPARGRTSGAAKRSGCGCASCHTGCGAHRLWLGRRFRDQRLLAPWKGLVADERLDTARACHSTRATLGRSASGGGAASAAAAMTQKRDSMTPVKT